MVGSDGGPGAAPVRRWLGEEPVAAARQAAGLFALAGLLAVVAIPAQPQRWQPLLTVTGADLTIAVVAWWLPWQRLPRRAPLTLAVPALVVLAFSTWVFGGFAAGTGPFFVLAFAWVGLHFSGRAVAALALPALVAYVVPLVITHQPPPVVSSAIVLLPIAVGVGWLISAQVTQLRLARSRAHQAERWRATLTATLAHDVRSPLAAIGMALRTLQRAGDRLTPAQRSEVIETASRQVKRMRRLAGGLLDAERLDAHGRLRLDLRAVPLAEAVREATAYLGADAVTVEVAAETAVLADPERLEQVLVNLTANAMRHGRPPVVIRAQPQPENGSVRVEIRDHGAGIPASRQQRLFGRFADSGADSVGLGLWIVQQLVQAHGGQIRYEAADPGSRFVVTLPAPRTG